MTSLPRHFIQPAIAAALALVFSSGFGDDLPRVPSQSERMSQQHPHAVFTTVLDVRRHLAEGAGTSCSLYAVYSYVMLRTGRQFDEAEFVEFRRWATAQGLFHPRADAFTGVVDFDPLTRRLPEFFGESVQALVYTLPIPMADWAESTAEALDAGRSVLALTSKETGAYNDADHVMTVLEAERDAGGQVVAFVVSDPDSYRFWESVNRVSVAELGSKLARPRMLSGETAAIVVSTVRAYELPASDAAI